MEFFRKRVLKTSTTWPLDEYMQRRNLTSISLFKCSDSLSYRYVTWVWTKPILTNGAFVDCRMSSPCDYLIIFHKIHLKSEQNFNPVHFTLSGCCSFTVNLVVKPKLTSPTLVDNQRCVALSFFLSIYLSNCELGNYGDDSTGFFH